MAFERETKKDFAIARVWDSVKFNKTTSQAKLLSDIMKIFSMADFNYSWETLKKYYYYYIFNDTIAELKNIYDIKSDASRRRVDLTQWRNGYRTNIFTGEEIKPPSASTLNRYKQKESYQNGYDKDEYF